MSSGEKAIWMALLWMAVACFFTSLIWFLRHVLIDLLQVHEDDARLRRLHALCLPALIWWTQPALERHVVINEAFHAYLSALLMNIPPALFVFLLFMTFRPEIRHASLTSMRRALNPKFLHRVLVLLAIALTGTGISTGYPVALSAVKKATNRNIVLISIDTLRPDFLDCYGASLGVSSSIDYMARGGLLFERAYSTSPWTVPSHMSMLTGLTPSEHGVNPTHNMTVLALGSEVPTMAELLRGDGYYTVAFTGGGYISPNYGFDRGFHMFKHPFTSAPLEDALIGDPIENGTRFIERHDPRREFFLFIHTYEVHDYFVDLGGTEVFRQPVDDSMLDSLRTAYIERIEKVDSKLNELFRAIDDGNCRKNTLVILTSDHGEGFYEHELLCHGNSLYDELVRVPLILTGPSLSAGARVRSPVSLTDLMPSILTWAGVHVPAHLRARPFIDLLDEAADTNRTIISFSENALAEPMGHMYTIRTQDYKYINLTERNKEMLYNIASDPREILNLSNQEPDILEKHRGMAEDFRKNMNRHPAIRRELTDELSNQLKALGYIE